ncbi:hypothetical protein KCU61_g7254, partial [Aureobasidium melanogenum]
MEKVPVTDLEAAAGEQTKWLWLLNAGDMAARARSGITLPENLPGTPVQIVELLAKPYALIEYESPDDAKAAFELECKAIFAYAALSVVESIMAKLPPNHPKPTVLSAYPPTYEFSNGLILMHEFITKEEEEEMIREYHTATASRDGRALKRGAVHYGPHFDYTTFAVSKSASTPPPEYLRRLLSRLPARDDRDIPDQYTLQHYPPGTGIPPHVDTHSAFEETIYSLSFGASTRMDFKLCGEKESRRLRLPKRSLGGDYCHRSNINSPAMRLVGIVASLAAAASAQQLLVYGDSALPSCAQQCTILQNAQTGCIPPAAPVTDATIYESCFCQSGYLTTLKAAGSTICSDVCDASDVAKIASWYQSNCADNGVAAAAKVSAGATTDSTSTTPASTATSSQSTSTSTSSSSSQGTSSSQDADPHHDWWTDHWKWIVMLIVVFVGLAILTTILVLLRRRYHRRQDLANAPFNSGITRHSIPTPSVTPPTLGKASSNQASRTSLPRVREKDRMSVTDVPVPPLPASHDFATKERGSTPDIEHGRAR